MQSVNFIPARRLHARGQRRRLRRWSCGCAVYAAALLGAYVLCCALYGGNRSAQAQDLNETKEQVQRTKQAICDTQGELSAAELRLRANNAVGDQPDWSLLLMLLSRSLTEEVVLRQCELGAAASSKAPGAWRAGANRPAEGGGPNLLSIEGYGRTQPDVSQFVLHLERLGLFDHVKLIKTSRQPFLTDSAVAFRVECWFGEQGGNPP